MTSPQHLASDAEEILDESMNGQESLRLIWRFEPSHLPLTLPSRLMRDFGVIVLVLIGAMNDGRHHRPEGIRRHIKVIAEANPYMPEYGGYFWRRRNAPGLASFSSCGQKNSCGFPMVKTE